MPKMTSSETEIVRKALALLVSGECEPLAVITVAGATHAEASHIASMEREFSGNGQLWNSAERRLKSLGAVLRFYGA